MLAWFIGFSTAMEIAEGLVALLTCYYALRFYGLTGEKSLLWFHVAFLLLGVGLMAHGISTGAVLFFLVSRLGPALAMGILRAMALVLFLCEAVGYGALTFSYVRTGREEGPGGGGTELALLSAAAPIGRRPVIAPEELIRWIRYHPLLEGVVLVMLVYLAFRTVYGLTGRGGLGSFLVGFAFLFLTIAHACFMLSPVLASLYVIAHIFQLLAFTCFLGVVLRVMTA